MTDDKFKADSLWSPRVSAEWLSANLPVQKDWLSWLAHDRQKTEPVVPFTKFAGYNVLYKRPDIEGIAELIYQSSHGRKSDEQ